MKKALLLGLAALTLSTPSLAQTKKAPADSAASKSDKAKPKPKQKQAQVDEIYAKVAELAADKLGVLPDKISPSARIVEDLGADGLDVVELILAIEDEFQIEISDKDAESFKTVGDMAIYVRRHQ